MKEFIVVKVELFKFHISLRDSSVHVNVVYTSDLISLLVCTLFWCNIMSNYNTLTCIKLSALILAQMCHNILGVY
jgi:hypothetical protein